MKEYKSSYRLVFLQIFIVIVLGTFSFILDVKINFLIIYFFVGLLVMLLRYYSSLRVEKIIFDPDKNEISIFETSRFNCVKNKYIYKVTDVKCEIHKNLTNKFWVYDYRFKIVLDRGILYDFSIYDDGWKREDLEDLIKQIEKI